MMSKKLSILIVLLTISLTAFSQRRGKMSPEKMAEHQTAKLQERFTEKEIALTDDVLEQVKALNLKYAEKIKKLREENKGDRTVMREVMRETEEEKRKELKKLLSKEQFKEYKKWTEEQRIERQERRGERGFGGK